MFPILKLINININMCHQLYLWDCMLANVSTFIAGYYWSKFQQLILVLIMNDD